MEDMPIPSAKHEHDACSINSGKKTGDEENETNLEAIMCVVAIMDL